MSYMVYDLILLGIFVIAVGSFLYRRRHNLKKEGLLFLYRTEWGIKLIERIGGKYKKTLKVMSYISVWLGYLLMVGMIYLTYTIVKIYVLHPEAVRAIKVPPIMPLIPYIDKVVSFLPPFYFTYWIVILAVIAISHEFAHGIFAAYNNIKTKKTGFGFFPFFLPVFLAAFVELDEKVMVKRSNFSQRAVLSAGTFANVITAVVFLIALGLFFTAAFSPAGVTFNDYSYSVVDVSSITMINGIIVTNSNMQSLNSLVKNASINEIKSNGKNYLGIKGFSDDEKQIALYDDSPAMRSGLNGAITEINGNKIKSINELSAELSKYSPGNDVVVKTEMSNGTQEYNIILGKSPDPNNPSSPWLGIGFYKQETKGFFNKIFASVSSFKQPNVYYKSMIGEFGWFIYYLIWWLVLISFSVALVNMLPVGIFDGGRFFYLTILTITGKEKWARKSFKFMTTLLILVLLALMVFWAYALIF
jgi:membrane-associated protease RseP (regulator of RpoE activity)